MNGGFEAGQTGEDPPTNWNRPTVPEGSRRNVFVGSVGHNPPGQSVDFGSAGAYYSITQTLNEVTSGFYYELTF